jgi:threonyl-tRNA synthetase
MADARSEEELHQLRHSMAHVMALAVQRMFPDAKFGIGPPTDDGFYYDFDLPEALTPDHLKTISKEMRKAIRQDLPFERAELSRDDALRMFADQPYKVELIDELPEGETISAYTTGEFTDLCRGPHVERTGQLPEKGYKLLSIAGAYWRGDEKNKMLQRIYATAWPSREELDEHLRLLAEAEKRDHRKLGKELDLFSVPPDLGPGLALFHPNGAIVRHEVEQFEYEEHVARGYKPVYTPHVYDCNVWKTSGHYDYYKDHMFLFDLDEREFGVKPMNCPGHVAIYASRLRSYRELPIKLFELGTVYRHELSGALHGLLRVTNITQDDAHIFCRPDQLTGQIIEVIEFAQFMMRTFGFDTEFALSTRPEKALGSEDIWEHATGCLRDALEQVGLSYTVDEGGGAFYGPKIDVMMLDALKRPWQGPTIQVDFNFPERFDLTYVTESDARERPVMVHRTVLGSMERFTGVLIEHYAGRFPTWLAPVQCLVLPVNDAVDVLTYADEVVSALRAERVRVEKDDSPNTLGYRIRAGQKQRVPYLLILGEKEAGAQTVSVRAGASGDQTGGVPLDEFVGTLTREIRSRSLTSAYAEPAAAG